MHPSALRNAKEFFEVYAKNIEGGTVLDIGSQDVNGSLRQVVPSRFKYVGVDFDKAKNVDVVLDNPYVFPFADEAADILITSSCLEHSEFFWLTWLEMLRVVKPNGLIYMNVPSEGGYHPYPVDCWRFKLNAATALQKWGKRAGFNPLLLEAFTDIEPPWHDYVAVFVRNWEHHHHYPDRISSDEV
jgi:SAM-dependent methyltransferase